MENDSTTRDDALTPEQAKAKAAILAECENLAAAGVTFVAVHFDGSGDSGVIEKIQCFDSDYYAYEEQKPVGDAAYLEEHFESLVPFGHENGCGGFADVVLDVAARKIRVDAQRPFRGLYDQHIRGLAIRSPY